MQATISPSPNPASLYFTKRLSSRLASMLSAPLTLVDAPMGYGKTVAVREYLRTRNENVLWVPVLGN